MVRQVVIISRSHTAKIPQSILYGLSRYHMTEKLKTPANSTTALQKLTFLCKDKKQFNHYCHYTQLCLRGLVLCSRYKDSPRAQRSGDQVPVGTRFPTPVQTGPGAHPTSCTVQWVLGLSPGGTAMRHGVDHSPPPSAEVKDGEQPYSTSGSSWTVPR